MTLASNFYIKYRLHGDEVELIKSDWSAVLDRVSTVVPANSPARRKHPGGDWNDIKRKLTVIFTGSNSRILIIGPANSGKSTIANLLIHGNVTNDNQAFLINVDSVEKSFRTNTASGNGFTITEATGIGRPSERQGTMMNPFSDEDAVKALRDMLVEARRGYHAIIFVASFDRSDEYVKAVYRVIVEHLFEDLKERIMFVVTQYPLGSRFPPHCPALPCLIIFYIF